MYNSPTICIIKKQANGVMPHFENAACFKTIIIIDMYRIEVNPKNIGVVLETPFSLNPTRVGVSYNAAVWHMLSLIVEICILM